MDNDNNNTNHDNNDNSNDSKYTNNDDNSNDSPRRKGYDNQTKPLLDFYAKQGVLSSERDRWGPGLRDNGLITYR